MRHVFEIGLDPAGPVQLDIGAISGDDVLPDTFMSELKGSNQATDTAKHDTCTTICPRALRPKTMVALCNTDMHMSTHTHHTRTRMRTSPSADLLNGG